MLNPRRLKLVLMALLFLGLALAGFAGILMSPKWLPALSGVNLYSPKYVALTNAVLAVICGAFLLWPREGSRVVGYWNAYVGAAFFTFVAIYGGRVIATVFENHFPTHTKLVFLVNFASSIIIYLGSYINNFLILAAARILLNKNRQLPGIKTLQRDERWSKRLRQEWLALRAALPDWYWKVLPVSLVPWLEELVSSPNVTPYVLWVRFPDAILSLYCLSWFAYALWLSFSVRKLKILAWLGFIFVLTYGAGQVVFATNPFIAHSIAGENKPQYFQLAWVQKRLPPEVTERIDQLEEDQKKRLAEDQNKSELKVSRFEISRRFFDGAIFAILFPMKVLLFLPPFILYLVLINSFNNFRHALHWTTSKRQDYFSAILSAIGRSTKADRVELIVRLPGLKWRGGLQERVIPKVWTLDGVVTPTEKLRPYPLTANPLLVRVMQTEGEQIVETIEDYGESGQEPDSGAGGPQTTALVPIRFHGGVIGVLQATFRGYGKFNNGTLEQLTFMCELIGLAVQDFRTVLVVDKLSQRLIRALASESAFKKTNQTKSIIKDIVQTLYDLLNPLGVCLQLECGFKSATLTYPKEGFHHELIEKLNFSYQKMLARSESNRVKVMKIDAYDGPVTLEPDQLIAGTELGQYNLGTLFLMIPADKDPFARPTLAAHYLTRRMLASMIAQAILSAARSSLSVVMHELSLALNPEDLSIKQWFANVENAAEQAGCSFVVASLGKGKPLLGQREMVEVISGMTNEDSANLISKPLGCIPYHVRDLPVRHIIHLKLGDDRRLWLGVERAEFGKELNFRSPWKVFLQDLTNVSSTALARIEERQDTEVARMEEENRRVREAESDRMKIIADVNTTLMHQLLTMVTNMRLSAVEFLENIDGDVLAQDDPTRVFIDNLKNKTEMMKELTRAYNEIIAGDGLGSCSVVDAARLAERLFRFEATRQLIKIDIDVAADVAVRVPSNVLAMALASLISNAIRAIKSRGNIWITTCDAGDFVNCHIVNNGPPIDNEVVAKLFELGAKGKSGGAGSGLYLVSRTLSNYGGEIELSCSDASVTCFTFRLPGKG